MASGGNFGFSGLNQSLNSSINNGFNTATALNIANLIIAVRVISIVLDENHPRFEELGGWNTLGAIEYELVEDSKTENPPSIAYPLSPNIKNYPLINEIVYLISLPNTGIGEISISKRLYYINIVSLWNHPHHNAYPTNPNNPPPEQNKDYIETQAGSVRQVTDQSTEIFLGNTFVERPNIHPLLPFEGDFIQEGRWGNSIRLGSTVKNRPNNWSNTGTNGDPITIIRNGQGGRTEEGWIPTTENINNDSSSIYLTSNQTIPLDASSTSYVSYEGTEYIPPSNPNTFEGKQIILNSGRLMFNSSTDHILLSSAVSINLNAQTSVNIDSNIFVVQSNDIYLGNKELATEPLMYGKKTTDLLRQLIQTLTPLVKSLQSIQTAPVVQGAPVIFKNLLEPSTNLLVILNSLKTELGDYSGNCTLISKNNFTV
jgi:hypothetical protein